MDSLDNRLVRFLEEFKYLSSREGVGLRSLPAHVKMPLLRGLQAILAESSPKRQFRKATARVIEQANEEE